MLVREDKKTGKSIKLLTVTILAKFYIDFVLNCSQIWGKVL